MPQCKNCQCEMPENAAFCAQCGTPAGANAAPSAPPPPMPGPPPPPPYYYAPGAPGPYGQMPGPPPPECYPYGFPGAPPPPYGTPPETVLLREPSNHLYPQGNVDNGLAVLTTYRVIYFHVGLGQKMLANFSSNNNPGKFVFDVPVAMIDHLEEQVYPHPQRQNLPLPFLALVLTDGRRFPLFFDRLPQWKEAIEGAVARAKEAQSTAAEEASGADNADEQK